MADHGRRLAAQEGAALPTPRTYAAAANGLIGAYTTGTNTILTIPNVLVQPRELLGILVWADLQSSAGSTQGVITAAASDIPGLAVGMTSLIATNIPTTRRTVVSNPDQAAAHLVDGTGDGWTGSFVWFHSYWDGAAEAGTVTGTVSTTLTIRFVRLLGSGTVSVWNPRAKILVI